MSRIFTTVAAIAATTLMSSAAFAGCNSGTYCTSSGHSSTLPSLSSWSGPSYATNNASSYASASSYSYGSSNSYSGNSYSGTVSSSYADSTYGTGSISNAYAGGDVQMYGFSGSTASVPGLGANESLQATSCPVSVHNPSGAKVLGCYNVVKPVPQTTYYRVVRPVVYVRYPVPVAVPYWSGCTVVTHTSRYGDRWGQSGYQGGHYGRRCG
ncbi:hypothetical protein [Hellea balneolensis]|uniref:hypothetical protein n=1 Tax=Hellea balneolensis TaxID=287478 RepID=UPI000421DB36|nr:hypothetical protein [Hellea balneolensis]